MADCAGAALTERAIGDGMTTDAKGRARSYNSFSTISLSGDNSVIGKYLQLSDSNDSEVACCLIEESE